MNERGQTEGLLAGIQLQEKKGRGRLDLFSQNSIPYWWLVGESQRLTRRIRERRRDDSSVLAAVSEVRWLGQ